MRFNIFHHHKNEHEPDQAEFPTVIGEYMTYRGDLVGAGNYLVHGKVEGNGNIDGHLLLGPTARWHGNVAATHLVVSGEVIGNVCASSLLELLPTAHVHGDIVSPVIAMAEGARYDGAIRSGPSSAIGSDEKRSKQ